MRTVTGRSVLYGIAAAVALGFSVEGMNAQDETPLPASATPPPHVQEREKVGKPPAPGKSPQVDELLQKLRLSRADIEQRKADKSQKELPAATDEPPAVKERKKVGKPPDFPGRSPAPEELLDKIRKQPGGAERLERARKAGAKIPPGRAGGAALDLRPGRMSGPRVEGPAFDIEVDAEQLPTLRVTKPAPSQNVAGLGSLAVTDYILFSSGYPYSYPSYWGVLYRNANPNSPGGDIDLKPFMELNLTVSNPGWYIINIVATRAKASLRRWNSATNTYVAVTQWDYGAFAFYAESYPYLVNLAAGNHYFYWVPEVEYALVLEASVMKF
jgi:hypothetical protein